MCQSQLPEHGVSSFRCSRVNGQDQLGSVSAVFYKRVTQRPTRVAPTGHPDSTRRHEVDPSSGLPRVDPARSYEAVPRCAEAGSAVADPPASKPAAGPVPRSGWKSESGPIDVDAIMSGVLEATAVSRPISNWPVRRKRTR